MEEKLKEQQGEKFPNSNNKIAELTYTVETLKECLKGNVELNEEQAVITSTPVVSMPTKPPAPASSKVMLLLLTMVQVFSRP